MRGVRKLPSDDDLKILFFDWGLRYKDIARIYGIARTQGIDARFRRMGYRKGHWKVPRDETELRALLSDESKSMSQKAMELGVSQSILYVHAKRLKEETKLDFNNAEYDEFIRPMRMERRMTIWKIARDLKVSTGFVQFRFKVLGIPARFRNQLVVKDPEALRAAISNKDLTYKEIADKFGIKRGIVQHYALKWGFRREKEYPPIDDNVLISKYVNDLWSVNRIAREFNYYGQSVKKRLVELGLYRDAKSLWRARVEKRARDTGSAFQVQAGGYPVIPIPEGHVTRPNQWAERGVTMAHIVEMEKKLGRPLDKHEKVHHINCRKDDFRIENLYLCKSNAEHMHIHGTIEKVVGMLYDAGLISFKLGYGYYLKKKPRDEDLVEVPDTDPSEPEILAK
jgi:hypothetical protein